MLTRIVLGCLVLLLVPDVAAARSFRVTQVPNGSRFGCGLCHAGGLRGGPRNGFGSQVESSLIGDLTSTAPVNWAAIYDLDGDSDRYSNGRELGDPDGTWSIGMASPPGAVYAPYDRAQSPCGDGVLETPPEECDTDQLPADVSCEMFGWGPGTLTCASTCRINQEQCEGYVIEVPNNANPPATNNDAGTNNNEPDGMTAAQTNNVTLIEDGEGEGCATGGSPIGSVWVLVFVGALARRRQSII